LKHETGWLGLAGVVLVDGGALDSVVGLSVLGVVVVNGGALDSVVGFAGGALDFSVEARRGGFSVEARRGGDSVVGLAGVVVVGFSVDFSVEARRGGDSVVGLAGVVVVGFSVDFRLGLGFRRLVFWVLPLRFRCTAWWWLTAWAWAWVHGVVVGNGFGFLVVEPWVSAWRWWSRAGSGFFFLFNSLVLKLWNFTVWLLRN
jgi:hypothetical protein